TSAREQPGRHGDALRPHRGRLRAPARHESPRTLPAHVLARACAARRRARARREPELRGSHDLRHRLGRPELRASHLRTVDRLWPIQDGERPLHGRARAPAWRMWRARLRGAPGMIRTDLGRHLTKADSAALKAMAKD